jgi:hypothetical protein
MIIQGDRRIYPSPTRRDEYPSQKKYTMNIEGYQLLNLYTIWMEESETGITKFITMYPDK